MLKYNKNVTEFNWGSIVHIQSYFLFLTHFSDCGIVVIGHFVWTILSVLFVFSLLGVADEKQLLVLKQLINGDETVGLIGRDFWLIGDTLAESSLAGMELNWLWSGLLFCLVVLGDWDIVVNKF